VAANARFAEQPRVLIQCAPHGISYGQLSYRAIKKPNGWSPSTPKEEAAMSIYFPEAKDLSRRLIFPGVSITTCAAEKMMMSHVDLEPGAVVPEHSHPHEQVGMVLAGKAIFYIGDESKTLGAGDMYRIPGNVRHRVVALEEPVRALDIFYPVREDYR
jgi:quercetin dioxygenase-like cupin family protein